MSSFSQFRTWAICVGAGLTLSAACTVEKDPKGTGSGGDSNGGKGASTNASGGADDAGQAGSATAGGDAGAGGSGTSGSGGGISGGDAGAGAVGSGGEGGSGAAGASGGNGGDGGGGTSGVDCTVDDGCGYSDGLKLLVAPAQTPAIPGAPMLWTITVGNTTNVAVKAVNVLLRVPKGLSFSSSLANPDSSACGNYVCSENEEATWKLGDLAPGATQTIELAPSVLTDVGEGDSIAAQVRLQATDVDALTVTKTVPVLPAPPAEVSLTASADPVLAGDTVELSVDVGHVGDAALFTGELKLELPDGVQVVEVSDYGQESSNDGQTVTWDLATLPVGASARRSVKAKIGPKVSSGEILNPRFSFSYEDAVAPSVAQTPISVIAKASPLVLSVAPAADPVVPGAPAHYEVTIANTSLRAVDGIGLWLHLPPELSFSTTGATEPDSTACGNYVCTSQELASWTIGTLEAGTSQTVSVDATALSGEAGDGTLVTAPFEVRALGITPLHAFTTIAVHQKPSAELMLGTRVGPVSPGETFTYDLDVGQVGAGSLQKTTAYLLLPAGVTLESSSNQGKAAGGVVSWDLGAIAVGATAHRTVTVTVDDGVAPGTLLEARAKLLFDKGQELDAVSEHTVTVVSEPLPLSVTIRSTPNPIVLGGTVSYTTTIKNDAERSIDGVELMLRVPNGLSYSSTSGADPDSSACGNYVCSGGEESTWNIGTIAAGATKTINISPTAATSLIAGSLATFRQRLTAVDLGGTLLLQTTLPTTK